MKYLPNITLAAFMHDIGKLYQRCADVELSDYNTTYCPVYNGHISHWHAGFTAQFFDNEKHSFLFERNTPDQHDSNLNVRNLAAYHHKPSTAHEWIIAIADRLASGMERADHEKYLEADDFERQQKDYKRARLISIFSSVNLKGNSNRPYYYPLEKLSPNIKPGELNHKTREQAERDYRKLRDDFEKEFEGLYGVSYGNFDNFYNALSSICEKYLWCVPSASFKTVADVSLFDHMKTASAIATALYVYHKANNTYDDKGIKDDRQDKFILVGGDFSGIQDFIFSRFGESNRYAAKILRAKSFFVSIYTMVVAHLLCREFETNSSSIIMSAGGRFILLLPNVRDAESKLSMIKKKANDQLIKLNYGQTNFNLSYVNATGNDLLRGKIAEKFDELFMSLAIDKFKPYIKSVVFKDYLGKVGKAGGVCTIDGFRPKEKDSDFSSVSNQMINVGERIIKDKYMTITFGKKGGFELIENEVYLRFGKSDGKETSYDLVYQIREYDSFSGYAISRMANYVPLFSEEDLSSSRYEGIPERISDQSEIEKGKMKSFYHIAIDSKEYDEKKDNYVGKSFLGILKADVDNLGLIFSGGFRSDVSLGKFVSLSRMLDYFFTGCLIEEIAASYRSIYTVFAGGDDLFLIGPYNQIIDFSLRIAEKFGEYVKNSDIHLSAGITIKKSQVPVFQMAEDAEEQLNMAKTGGKNRVAIFGRVVDWIEYGKLLEKVDLFKKYLMGKNGNTISTSYLYKILKFIKMKDAIEGKDFISIKELNNAKWIAYFRYTTHKVIKDEAFREEVIKNFYDDISNYGDNLYIPISITLYKMRN